ncbi:MAG: recombinase family protein, partial [Planctomycetes bacterium]|nr:recombinase family protein [Planctomycetota bacterium]
MKSYAYTSKKDGSPMLRAANYARYSSENQRETSITDQFYLGEVYAQRAGWPAPIRFSDAEISASTPTLLRPGGRALMEAIRAGQIDILLVEALHRCWRDIVDQEQTIREIERLGVRIIGISDGYDSNREGRELQRIFIGGVNQQYLRDLAKAVHRTQTGIAVRGGNAGGLAYGYRSVPDGDGHRLEIDETEAATVRWIFASYADGLSLREIAYDLNSRAVPSPRGGTWAVSALFGSPAKGSGILNNTLYAGRYVWNRSQWIKHPDTGIRKRKERDRSDWIVKPRPDLRIVDEENWAKVERRMAARKPMKTGRRPSYLLSGILRCGVCGGAYVVVYRGQYGCAAHKDRGPSVCGNGLRVRRDDLERDILAAVKVDLLAPDKIEAFRRELAAALK